MLSIPPNPDRISMQNSSFPLEHSSPDQPPTYNPITYEAGLSCNVSFELIDCLLSKHDIKAASQALLKPAKPSDDMG
jgi:hypothetical protein